MADMDQDGVDLETLQAQIDMSMAFTHNLVSGWMKASKVKLPSARADADAELEESLRRPQRLGVGASVPESTGILSRETAKLRNKLIGSHKKRAREEDDHSGPITESKPIVISDDDEDSRARVITKKARVDPFAPRSKQKKKGKADPHRRRRTTSPLAKGSAVATELEDVDMVPADDMPDVTGALPTPSKRRKKKKKHKTQGDGRTQAATTPDSTHAANATAPPPETAPAGSRMREVIEIADTPPTAPSPLPPLGSPARGGAKPQPPPPPKAASSSGAPSGPGRGSVVAAAAAATSTATTTAVRPAADLPQSQSTPRRLDPFGFPLLNLSGPPPGIEDAPMGSPKKKRKKKKKKKKKGGAEIPGNGEVIDVDADEHDHGEDD
ncbi:hypothetical protein C8Q80DRAFT_1157791 [Daedaleopsis nitida]|nr:hypothetical protein C8Q80DRAFT_1157791 [Daedaleopsis nitida]